MITVNITSWELAQIESAIVEKRNEYKENESPAEKDCNELLDKLHELPTFAEITITAKERN